MHNLTIILPVYELEKFSNYIAFNLKIFKKLKIKTLIISDKKEISKYKNRLVKTFFAKKFENAREKFLFGLKKVNSEYIYLLREDTLIHEYGFKNLFKKMRRNKEIVSVQGLQFIALSKKYNLIFPHNPRTVTFNFDEIKSKNLDWKIKNILINAPECYWTFHKTDLFSKFWTQYNRFGYFKDKNIAEYFFIFFLLSFGEISFEPIPVNLRIKTSKLNKYFSFDNYKKNYSFYRSLNKLCFYFKKNRNLGSKKTLKLLKESFKIRLKHSKPRDLLMSYNLLQKKILILKKIFNKLNRIIFFTKNIISKYDKFYISDLEKKYYQKIIDDKNYDIGFKKMMKELV